MAVSKKVNHGKKRKKRSIYQQNLIDKNKRRRLTVRILIVSGIVVLIALAVFAIFAFNIPDHIAGLF